MVLLAEHEVVHRRVGLVAEIVKVEKRDAAARFRNNECPPLCGEMMGTKIG